MVLKTNLIANYFGQGWSALMGIAFIPLYIHYLGIEAYGLIGLFALLQAWLRLLDMGMTPTLVREMGRFLGGGRDATSIRDLLRSVEIVAVIVAVIMAVATGLAANWLASAWLQAEKISVPIATKAFTAMGAVAALRFVEGIYRSCIVGLQRQVVFNVIISIMATLRGLGTVAILAWVSTTIQAFFIWQGLVSLATLVLMAVATYTSLPPTGRSAQLSLAELRGVWRFAGGMVGISLLTILLTQVDKLLLSRMLSLSEFGCYTLAATMASAIYMLIAPISQAWFPRLSQLHASEDHEGLTRAFHQGAQMVTVMQGSASVVMITFSDTLLELWTQDKGLAHQAASIVSVLALGNLLNGLMWIPYQTQLAHGWTTLTARINIVAVLLIVPAILWVTPRYGAVGAAWAWTCLNAGYVMINIHFMCRRILTAEKWRWYWQDLLQPLLPAISVVAMIRWAVPAPQSVVPQVGTLALAYSLALFAAALAAPMVRQPIHLLTAPLSALNRGRDVRLRRL